MVKAVNIQKLLNTYILNKDIIYKSLHSYTGKEKERYQIGTIINKYIKLITLYNIMSYYGQAPPTLQQPMVTGTLATQPPSANTSGQKHDIFVGNLAFNTTEEQLYSAFSELGRIIKVRMVTDNETGKPRGFAFIEFEDPQAALSAIRNMNEYEINGRKIRVNFSNSSHLETLANQLGMDLGTKDEKKENTATSTTSSSGVAGSKAVAQSLKSMNKGELYDVVAKLKEIADSNPDEARKVLTQHPQLPEAILYCMSEVCIIILWYSKMIFFWCNVICLLFTLSLTQIMTLFNEKFTNQNALDLR